MITKLDIDPFLSESENHPVIDVRSPLEYEHAHIPGAINLPLFSNEERAIIGTLYKQKGRETAMLKGLECYGANMHHIISDLKNATDDKQLFVHCWRGGMRSGVAAWMLDLFGYKVSTLNKGYKAFRNAALQSFFLSKNILIVGGKTGSAKTEVIHELKAQNEQVIDLEGIAHHKGSAFGALGEMKQPMQEQFENDLFMQFRKIDSSKPVWLEDESQRVGLVNIPNALWDQMRSTRVMYLDIPFEERLNYLVKHYGNFDIENLKDATLRIQKRLGGLNTKLVLQFLEEKNFHDAFSILLNYYDKFYERATSQRIPASIQKIYSEKIDATLNAQQILKNVSRTLTTREINPS